LNRHQPIALIIAILLISLVYFGGLSSVPFHPDEQTCIYMSEDFERFFKNPEQLFWNPANTMDLKQKYRLRDAPLTRWLIAIGRQIARLPPPQVDWDWSADWKTNLRKGALPNKEMLLVSRWSVAILFPFSLWLIFQVAKSAGGNLMAWVALLGLASNALVLLHTRRAMAESGLIFTILITLWSTKRYAQQPYLTAIAAALAFNAKQSALPLAMLCFGMTLLPFPDQNANYTRRLQRAFLFGLIFIAITLVLNPVLWRDPLRASLAAWRERMNIVNEQVLAIQSVSPEMVWQNFPQRALGLIGHLFFTRPAVADVANYLEELRPAEEAYFSNPFHNLMRNWAGGIFTLLVTLFGFFIAPLQARHATVGTRWMIGFLWVATLLQGFGLVWVVSLPFQRYVLPMVPFVCLWFGKGIEAFIFLIKSLMGRAFEKP